MRLDLQPDAMRMRKRSIEHVFRQPSRFLLPHLRVAEWRWHCALASIPQVGSENFR